jgi:hypothetical protein
MNLCKYKNILGVLNKGIHSYRLFNIAVADVIMTILGAFLISFFFKLTLLPFIYVLIFLFILGIVLHRLFCVRTTIDKLIFPNIIDK